MSASVTSRCLATLLVVAATSCGSSALLGPDALQGIEGLVLRGPLCPVHSADDPCPDAPYQARIDVHTVRGDRVAAVRSGEDGRFRVGLEPGAYVLHPESGNPFPRAEDLQVQVVEGVYSDVTVRYDTGIR